MDLYTSVKRHTPSSFWLIDGIIGPSTATADDQVIMNNTCSMDTTQHGNIKNRIQWSKNCTMGCITRSSSLEGCLIIKQWLKKGNLKLCAPKVTLICVQNQYFKAFVQSEAWKLQEKNMSNISKVWHFQWWLKSVCCISPS